MKQKAMRFTVIRFVPHVQTQEFANIGIIAACPNTGYFDYKIESKYTRLRHFFQHFDVNVYCAMIESYGRELDGIKSALQGARAEQIRAALDKLTQPSATILQTNGIGTSLADSEEQELSRLFEYYVHANFVGA